MFAPIEIYDTTLRDGTQGEAVSFSVDDKLLIAKKLDEFGIRLCQQNAVSQGEHGRNQDNP